MVAGSCDEPRPKKPKLSGHASEASCMRQVFHGPPQSMAKSGPMVPPIMVVSPLASAWLHCSADIQCTCTSMPPGVTIRPPAG